MKYFTIVDINDKPPTTPVTVDTVGLRERITSTEQFKRRALSTTFNMFFKDFPEVCFIAPNVTLKIDPETLYEPKDVDAMVFKFEKILDTKPPAVSAVWDVAPQSYLMANCIMIKNPIFAKEWLEMTGRPFFKNYSEMDLLNMLTYYGDYRVLIRDVSEL